MRIINITTLRADGGWRPLSFLKLETDEGLVGWSEFSEGPWSPSICDVIQALGKTVIGDDPRQYALLSARLHATTLFTAGGLSNQAIAAIENACVDVAAKAAGLPVYALFGGPFRTEIELYWSHCGSFRVRHPDFFERVLGKPRITKPQDFCELGREAIARGFRAVKTNPIAFESGGPRLMNPGFNRDGLAFEKTVNEKTLSMMTDQVIALRDGLGPGAGHMFDVNFGFRPEAVRRIAQAIAPSRPTWLEVDMHDPAALASVRAAAGIPIASLESIYGRRGYRPYFQAQAVAVAVVDVPWNGFAEAVRIASMAEAFEVNVAPHNFYGPLADLMSAHFCAGVGNIAIMEIEGDDVPWKYGLLTTAPEIKDGRLVVPTDAGWGADINEDAVKDHPWKGMP
jgi:galactonate dehydratase